MSRRNRDSESSSGNPRRERVAHVLRQAITEALATDIKDPRVAAAEMLTVTRVEMNVDMAIANVYVSVVGDAAGAIAGLRTAAGFLRGRVARAAGLQRAPELRFFADHSVDMSEKIAQILRDDADRASQTDCEIESSPPPSDMATKGSTS